MVALWSAALVAGLAAVAALMQAQYTHLKEMGGFMRIAGILAFAACVAENSCISWYKYYHYSDEWGIFLGHVPLHVVLIWPLFILGEHRYLRSLCNDLRLRALLCFVDVALLANLVEIYCVAAKLWFWKESNCLGVPWIGVLGWALFATPAVLLLSIEEARPNTKVTLGITLGLTLVLCLATLHGGLVLVWQLGLLFNLRLGSVRPQTEALAISLIQLLYHLATRRLPRPQLRQELPRLLACGILAALLLKGRPLPIWELLLVSGASMLRILAFQL
ncbi:unnamed protein product [Symbiodinium natans]|uniref:Uncharacterized protein n=1 Tax=Symbiodinium natans TaxID=878477 RepID=A0A812MCA3_9DINO|nr:unnamed protein product [Symbiodinium natans]